MWKNLTESTRSSFFELWSHTILTCCYSNKERNEQENLHVAFDSSCSFEVSFAKNIWHSSAGDLLGDFVMRSNPELKKLQLLFYKEVGYGNESNDHIRWMVRWSLQVILIFERQEFETIRYIGYGTAFFIGLVASAILISGTSQTLNTRFLFHQKDEPNERLFTSC